MIHFHKNIGEQLMEDYISALFVTEHLNGLYGTSYIMNMFERIELQAMDPNIDCLRRTDKIIFSKLWKMWIWDRTVHIRTM